MKKFVAGLLVFALFLITPLALMADVQGGCVSQYCACDGQMHPCDFSEAQCRALCGGGGTQAPTNYNGYHDSNMDIFLISFLVTFAIIGLILWVSGSLNTHMNTHAQDRI